MTTATILDVKPVTALVIPLVDRDCLERAIVAEAALDALRLAERIDRDATSPEAAIEAFTAEFLPSLHRAEGHYRQALNPDRPTSSRKPAAAGRVIRVEVHADPERDVYVPLRRWTALQQIQAEVQRTSRSPSQSIRALHAPLLENLHARYGAYGARWLWAPGESHDASEDPRVVKAVGSEDDSIEFAGALEAAGGWVLLAPDRATDETPSTRH